MTTRRLPLAMLRMPPPRAKPKRPAKPRPMVADTFEHIIGGHRFTLPVRLVSEANQRECHQAKGRRVQSQRRVVGLTLEACLGTGRARLVALGGAVDVTITRLAPRMLDDDNAVGSAKAVRDAIAAWLGVDDRHRDIVRYRVEQQKSREWGVRIDIVRRKGGGDAQ